MSLYVCREGCRGIFYLNALDFSLHMEIWHGVWGFKFGDIDWVGTT